MKYTEVFYNENVNTLFLVHYSTELVDGVYEMNATVEYEYGGVDPLDAVEYPLVYAFYETAECIGAF